MASDLLTNPQHWRDRAKEIRVLAERSTDPETKRTLKNIVADYELLAGGGKTTRRHARQLRLAVLLLLAATSAGRRCEPRLGSLARSP
jgi:hypothetical protein